MNSKQILQKIIEEIELPKSAYEKAEQRYQAIGNWLTRESSSCRDFEPHILPQGSFRLGTAIKPLNKNEDYDLDLTCKYKRNITKQTLTQYDLKKLLEEELESYREANGINDNLEEKRRCWRFIYADQLSFHMDIVPAIPTGNKQKETLTLMFSEHSEFHEYSDGLKDGITDQSIYITDNEHPDYKNFTNNWLISNPEGYALWFEERMKQSELEFSERANIENLPIYEQKNPLQQSIQILKRHRDNMFKNAPDGKPISIIITTLAARYYQGNNNVEEALTLIIAGLNKFCIENEDVVLNPTNPEENFADKWQENLELKDNFQNWVKQLSIDFNFINNPDEVILNEKINQSFAVDLNYTPVVAVLDEPEELETPATQPWLHTNQ